VGDELAASSDLDAIALHLIDLIYRSAAEPAHWDEFAAEFSRGCGRAAVAVAVPSQAGPSVWSYFGRGVVRELVTIAEDRYRSELDIAWSSAESFRAGFCSLRLALPDQEIGDTEFFQSWMRPRGFAPIWPMAHAVMTGSVIRCWLVIFARAGGAFDEARIADLGSRLVAHLDRALGLYAELGALHHKRRALEEVLDRLQTGVILIDAGKQVVLSNLSAQRMVALEDGLSITEGRLRASEGHDAALQEALDAAVDAATHERFEAAELVAIESSSGRRPFQLAVTPLLAALPDSPAHDAVAVALLANADAVSASSVQILKALYGLTNAEAAIVQGLAEGGSLEEVSAGRGVTTHTARSQLKQIFAKTGVSRQVELIGLVLTGVSPMRQTSGTEETPS
jgi:DNA-binding CsgD family transcriptional regulator